MVDSTYVVEVYRYVDKKWVEVTREFIDSMEAETVRQAIINALGINRGYPGNVRVTEIKYTPIKLERIDNG